MTALERTPEPASRLAPGKVGVLGFFRGGSAALALAGARIDAQSYTHSCGTRGTGLDCEWYEKNGVDLRQIDAVSVARSHLDSRIKAAVVIDPELSRHFTTTSLKSIIIPLQLIALGQAATRPADLDTSALQASVTGLQYSEYPDATRFDAFPACKPQGSAILREDGGDEAICARGTGPSRDEIHTLLAKLSEAFFRQTLR